MYYFFIFASIFHCDSGTKLHPVSVWLMKNSRLQNIKTKTPTKLPSHHFRIRFKLRRKSSYRFCRNLKMVFTCNHNLMFLFISFSRKQQAVPKKLKQDVYERSYEKKIKNTKAWKKRRKVLSEARH